jgi:hypothetical protein
MSQCSLYLQRAQAALAARVSCRVITGPFHPSLVPAVRIVDGHWAHRVNVDAFASMVAARVARHTHPRLPVYLSARDEEKPLHYPDWRTDYDNNDELHRIVFIAYLMMHKQRTQRRCTMRSSNSPTD